MRGDIMNDRDMYYGYNGFVPMNSFQLPFNTQVQSDNYTMGIYTDMDERIKRLERQVKRLDQRLTRIETPYANNNEPDNNMYIM